MEVRRKFRVVFLALALSTGVVAPTIYGDTYEDGVAAAQRGDYATAMPILREFAANGHADAQTNFAIMYEKGLGVP